MKGDPNAIRGRRSGRPVWVPYKQGARKVVLFSDENEELIGGGVGTTAKLVDDEWSKAGGDFWWEKTEVSQQ